MLFCYQDTINVLLHEPSGQPGVMMSPCFWLGIVLAVILLLFLYKPARRLLKNIKPDEYELNLAGFKIKGKLQYYSKDQEVAWKIYVELVTRVSGNRLAEGTGILRESLNSLHKVFGILRNILREAGPLLAEGPRRKGRYTVATLLIKIMNDELRPFLSKWHPLLESYEKNRAETESQFEHEQKWELNQEFRAHLNGLHDGLEEYISTLKSVAES
ncbi:MAG: hypothetical protein WCK34_09585 [Bacteroidota bacterium]